MSLTIPSETDLFEHNEFLGKRQLERLQRISSNLQWFECEVCVNPIAKVGNCISLARLEIAVAARLRGLRTDDSPNNGHSRTID